MLFTVTVPSRERMPAELIISAKRKSYAVAVAKSQLRYFAKNPLRPIQIANITSEITPRDPPVARPRNNYVDNKYNLREEC